MLIRNLKIKCLNMHQQAEFDNATHCYLCRHEFKKNEMMGPKVRDYDHITGDFFGAAHRQCNLEPQVSFQIPVFFHNFRGYDAYLIVHEFGKRPDREIKVIGQNMKSNSKFSGSTTWSFVTRCSFFLSHLRNWSLRSQNRSRKFNQLTQSGCQNVSQQRRCPA